jgi:hypothetical protein
MDEKTINLRLDQLEKASQSQAAYLLALTAILKHLPKDEHLDKAKIYQEIDHQPLPFGGSSIGVEAKKVVDMVL